MNVTFLFLVVSSLLLLSTVEAEANDVRFLPEIKTHIEQSMREFNQIPDQRKIALEKIARYVGEQIHGGADAKLVFICTHNSRRSHMSQIWAQTAARYYGIPRVTTYSGGTEATVFNPRAAASLQRAGFVIDKRTQGPNPVYRVRFDEESEPIEAFSKVFSELPNPRKDFCAVMTCSQADKACPSVPGASLRVSIPYDDPKAFDGTKQETEKYDERCRQIAREMLYMFSRVRQEPGE
jgi:protein-tyrosine-phosphatase